MIIPAQHIRSMCDGSYGAKPMIEPFVERSVSHGMSYGLSIAGYDIRIKQTVTLYPLGYDDDKQSFALASTVERFDIPSDVLGHVADKSTWARRGMAVQNTILEPGWNGYLTIELSNHGSEVLKIESGMPIAQIVFHRLEAPVEKAYSGKYQGQEDRPIAARDEANA